MCSCHSLFLSLVEALCLENTFENGAISIFICLFSFEGILFHTETYKTQLFSKILWVYHCLLSLRTCYNAWK